MSMKQHWEDLHSRHRAIGNRRITDLFDADDRRAEHFHVALDALYFDYAKTQIDAETRTALIDLCEGAGLTNKRAAMFAGAAINETENRAVLHTALRAPGPDPIVVDGIDVLPEIHSTRARMTAFASAVRDGKLKGAGGTIRDVINIGIGGSHLGPAMAVHALAPYHDGPACHFVSNVDGADIADTLKTLDPTRTLVLVASKTFTTIETMTNAETALTWMKAGGGDPAPQLASQSSATD